MGCVTADGWETEIEHSRLGLAVRATKGDDEIELFLTDGDVEDAGDNLLDYVAEAVLAHHYAQRTCDILGHEWQELSRFWSDVLACRVCRKLVIAGTTD